MLVLVAGSSLADRVPLDNIFDANAKFRGNEAERIPSTNFVADPMYFARSLTQLYEIGCGVRRSIVSPTRGGSRLLSPFNRARSSMRVLLRLAILHSESHG